MEEALYRYLLLMGLVQFIPLTSILYNVSSGTMSYAKRKWLVAAFFLYGIHLFFFESEVAAHLEVFRIMRSEVAGVMNHLFFIFFFIAIGYGLMSVLVETPLLRKMTKHIASMLFLVVVIIAFSIVILEGEALSFSHTENELIFEGLHVVLNLGIIVILYDSWRETRSKRLFLDTIAFSIFLAGNMGHIFTLFSGAPLTVHLRFTLGRYLLSTISLIILAYTTIPIVPYDKR